MKNLLIVFPLLFLTACGDGDVNNVSTTTISGPTGACSTIILISNTPTRVGPGTYPDGPRTIVVKPDCSTNTITHAPPLEVE